MPSERMGVSRKGHAHAHSRPRFGAARRVALGGALRPRLRSGRSGGRGRGGRARACADAAHNLPTWRRSCTLRVPRRSPGGDRPRATPTASGPARSECPCCLSAHGGGCGGLARCGGGGGPDPPHRPNGARPVRGDPPEPLRSLDRVRSVAGEPRALLPRRAARGHTARDRPGGAAGVPRRPSGRGRGARSARLAAEPDSDRAHRPSRDARRASGRRLARGRGGRARTPLRDRARHPPDRGGRGRALPAGTRGGRPSRGSADGIGGLLPGSARPVDLVPGNRGEMGPCQRPPGSRSVHRTAR